MGDIRFITWAGYALSQDLEPVEVLVNMEKPELSGQELGSITVDTKSTDKIKMEANNVASTIIGTKTFVPNISTEII